jgi:hypothetical protein
MFVNKTTQPLCTVLPPPWLSCILHEGLLSLTPHPRPTEGVTEAVTAIDGMKTDSDGTAVVNVTASPFVTVIVRRAGHGESIGPQSPDLPLGAKVPSTMTTFEETLPHLPIANLSLGQSSRHCPPERSPSGEIQLLKMDTLIVNRKTCIEGMAGLMEVATILNGAQFPFYS